MAFFQSRGTDRDGQVYLSICICRSVIVTLQRGMGGAGFLGRYGIPAILKRLGF